MGYECRNCGYEPDHGELQRGTCPGCSEFRRTARSELESLDELPLGSVVQVFSTYYHRYGESQTIMLWVLTHRDARDNSKARWEAKQGWVEFWNEVENKMERVYVTGSGYIRNPTYDTGTSSAVSHNTIGETYYRAWYRIHNASPLPATDRLLARERMSNEYQFLREAA